MRAADIMASALESLSNEILMGILSYFSWNELLTSWWCLNAHLNSLLCTMFWSGEARIIFNRPGLSYKECSSTFIPMITQSSDLSSSVRYMHLDGSNSLVHGIFEQWLYCTDNRTSKLRFLNLKSLVLTRFLLSEPSINCLSRLVRDQLTHLRIEVDKDQCNSALSRDRSAEIATARNGKWWWRIQFNSIGKQAIRKRNLTQEELRTVSGRCTEIHFLSFRGVENSISTSLTTDAFGWKSIGVTATGFGAFITWRLRSSTNTVASVVEQNPQRCFRCLH